MKLSFCKVCAPSDCKTDKKPYHKGEQLIYGPVYLNCEGLKRNGLQQWVECKRAQCIYNPDCNRRKTATLQNNRAICCKNPNGSWLKNFMMVQKLNFAKWNIWFLVFGISKDFQRILCEFYFPKTFVSVLRKFVCRTRRCELYHFLVENAFPISCYNLLPLSHIL